jgi:cell division septal protein FtsQ
MSFGRAFARGLPRGRRLSLPRPRLSLRSRLVRRLLVVAILLGALALGGWLWLRDSSLVAVTKVRVTGVSGPDAGAIRSALVGASRGMTTLDVNMAQLRSAVSPFPVVSDLRVSTQFPHGMRIRVIERPPVAMVSIAGKNVAVAGDGTLLHDMALSSPLPLIPLTVPPGGPRLTGAALGSAKLLAAAPYALLPKITQVSSEPGHGLTAQIRGGPRVYFGNGLNARAKWLAASAVLADPGSVGASYIDVADPVRPAAGVGGSSGSASGGSSASASTGSSASASSGGSGAASSASTSAAAGNTGAGSSSAGNSGAGNTGSGNTGSGNSGAGNTGSGNTGSGNSGAGNSGSGNSGGGPGG